jgi:hypothetical protein
MKNKIPNTFSHGAAWAADNIESPFIFFPLAIAAGSALQTTGIPVISNIQGCPGVFPCVDADSTADNNEGYFTPDPTNDNDYFWPGAGHDYNPVTEDGLFSLGRKLLSAGTVNGIGGGRLFLAATIFNPTGAVTNGGLLSFGNRNTATNADGISIGINPATGALNLGIQKGLTVTQADLMNASLSQNSAWRCAVLLDFAHGEILSARNGVAQTVSGKATLLPAADELTLTGAGWMFGALNSGTTIDARTPSTSPETRVRDLFIMDLSGYDNAQADFYELADRLARAPTYSLPHWMDRF